jgi:adenine-specific DNA-methyltransferase
VKATRSAPRHRKLRLWASLPPYLGGKRRLCPTIFREIDRLIPRRLWARVAFLDAFLGGGSVSLFAKAQGFIVTACDIADRAIVVGEGLIENCRVRLTREDVLRLARDDEAAPGRVETEYSPSVFTKDQARFIDRTLRIASETQDQSKAALYRLLAIRVALLAHPMSQVRKGTIHRLTSGDFESITESCLYHYVDGLRLTRPGKLWEIAQAINAGVFEGRGEVRKRSVLEALPEIEAGVAYFDPPYPGVMSYEKEYRVIDEILEGRSRPTSPFTAKDGASMLDQLFERALHIPVWILSLGNEVVAIEELEAKMTRLGRKTKALEIAYQHLPAVATEGKKERNREFLVVGWDPDLLGGLLQRVATEHSFGIHLDDLVPTLVQKHLGHGGSAGSAPLSFFSDGQKERHAAFAQEGRVVTGESIPIADAGPDTDRALLEAGFDGDGEDGPSNRGHDPTFPWLWTQVNQQESEPRE